MSVYPFDELTDSRFQWRLDSGESAMTVETVRQTCMSFPRVTEDVKWGNDLVFSVGQKMFVALDIEPPHSIAFKCSPEVFHELVERDGIIPAPYLARAMWVQERGRAVCATRGERHDCLRRTEIEQFRLSVAATK